MEGWRVAGTGMWCTYTRSLVLVSPLDRALKDMGDQALQYLEGVCPRVNSRCLEKVNDTDSQGRNMKQPDGQDIIFNSPKIVLEEQRGAKSQWGTSKVYFFLSISSHMCAAGGQLFCCTSVFWDTDWGDSLSLGQDFLLRVGGQTGRTTMAHTTLTQKQCTSLLFILWAREVTWSTRHWWNEDVSKVWQAEHRMEPTSQGAVVFRGHCLKDTQHEYLT